MQKTLKQLMSTLCDDAAEVVDAEDLDAFVEKTIIALDAFRTAVDAKYSDDEIIEFCNNSVMNKHVENLEIDFD